MKIEKNIKTIAKNVLLNEANAIKKIIDFLDDDFTNCIQTILKSKGRVIITGIGKSAIIAQKIVATLNSTGTPSVFMHAADAIHGDLGIVQKSDIVICISKSGNTPEVRVLIPLIKRKGTKLVALVADTDSQLAKQADFVLNASIKTEACPNNLAPTTSTTTALALGDALAVCLMEARNFGSKDFAKLHPGGSLGKRLYLKVSDIYPNNELPVVKENDDINDIIVEMTSKRLGATAVLNDKKDLVGIITDGDLRRMLRKHKDLSGLKAKNIMGKKPKTIEDDAYAVKALEVMQSLNITQIIVTKNQKLKGFVHLHDLLKEGIV